MIAIGKAMKSVVPAWLINLGDRLRTSFWFLPFLMALSAIALAIAMSWVDRSVEPKWREGISWIYSGGEEGARAVLSTLAGSMITVAGVVYSITVVVLTLASSQFGPRLMRNFIGDRVNQTVLGVFVASFVYCLLVLRSIGAPHAGAADVPNLSVTVGVVLGVLSLLVLIYFIHHIATSIQAFSVISAIAGELDKQIDSLFPESIGAESDDSERGAADVRANADDADWITADGAGYLRLIDDSHLLDSACDNDLVIELYVRPGDFVVRDQRLAAVRPKGKIDARGAKRLRAAFLLGDQRTNVQDANFAVDQLVEIALRALSPGVNDPFTALQCIHRLGDLLSRMVARSMPAARRAADGALRVVAPAPTFAAFLARAFDPLRVAAARQPQVLAALLETLATIDRAASSAARRRALAEHARAVLATADDALTIDRDREIVHTAGAHFTAARGTEPGRSAHLQGVGR